MHVLKQQYENVVQADQNIMGKKQSQLFLPHHKDSIPYSHSTYIL